MGDFSDGVMLNSTVAVGQLVRPFPNQTESSDKKFMKKSPTRKRVYVPLRDLYA